MTNGVVSWHGGVANQFAEALQLSLSTDDTGGVAGTLKTVGKSVESLKTRTVRPTARHCPAPLATGTFSLRRRTPPNEPIQSIAWLLA